LARLAVDTGGRYTERTNDLTAGYSRARSDLTCIYSVGFYVDEPEEDRVRNLVVRAKRKGLRALHPSKYVFRSPEVQRQSLLQAAWVAPDMFETGVVRAHVFPLSPVSKRAWDALLAINFEVPLGEIEGDRTRREFGGILYRDSKIVHRFNRWIDLVPKGATSEASPTVTFLERVELEPGRYELRTVLSHPGEGDVHAATVELALERVPRKELFLVGPVLGRRAGGNVVVTAGDDPAGDRVGRGKSFEPLLVHWFEEPVDLVAFSQACMVGGKASRKGHGPPTLERALRDAGDDTVGTLPGVDLALEGSGRIRCQNLVDVLPLASLADGEYTFEARLAPDGDGVEGRSVRFAIGAAGTAAAP
jgi:hypothetical protein